MSLIEEKSELRQLIKTKLAALSAEEAAERSLRAAENFISLPEYDRADIVLAFLSMGEEIRTETLIGSALAAGKLVAVPRMERSLEKGRSIVFIPLPRDYRSWPRDRFGIPEPPKSSPALAWEEFASRRTIVATPGLAFDRSGGRLGRGAGYYDRFLASARAAGPLIACGFCYSIQLVDAVPINETDAPVDIVATEDGAIICSAV